MALTMVGLLIVGLVFVASLAANIFGLRRVLQTYIIRFFVLEERAKAKARGKGDDDPDGDPGMKGKIVISTGSLLVLVGCVALLIVSVVFLSMQTG